MSADDDHDDYDYYYWALYFQYSKRERARERESFHWVVIVNQHPAIPNRCINILHRFFCIFFFIYYNFCLYLWLYANAVLSFSLYKNAPSTSIPSPIPRIILFIFFHGKMLMCAKADLFKMMLKLVSAY